MTTSQTLKIIKNHKLNCNLTTAYELFTRRLGQWWPLKKHSVSGEKTVNAQLEEFIGGRVFETTIDGRMFSWGHIETINSPSHFIMAWYPGTQIEMATRVEIKFKKISDKQTEIELKHTGWHVYGNKAEEYHKNYSMGWDEVLSGYIKLCSQRR